MMKPVQSIYGTIRFSLKDNMGTGTGRDALIGWADVKLEVSHNNTCNTHRSRAVEQDTRRVEALPP